MIYTEDWTKDKCDKYDYLMAAFSGISTGLMDAFFVGEPGKSKLCNFTDKQADNLVKKFATMIGWKPRDGKEENVASAIGFLEKRFKVNYDQAKSTDVNGIFEMGTKNHHYKSLSHSPDIVGLFFSILDQFQGKSSFLSDGRLIRIDTNAQGLGLYGEGFIAKLFCGFCNWIGHIMSDLAGSSGGRGRNTGRGSGVSIPFMELFLLCDFGELNVGKNKQTLATVMTEVFQSGYDLRFGAAMAIPVVINELIIRVLWVIKRHFYKKKEWKECIPNKKYADLRIMLLVGQGSFCIVDGIDAIIRSGGNAVKCILRLNIIGWARIVILIFNELKIRYGNDINKYFIDFMSEIKKALSYNERKILDDYYNRVQEMDMNINNIIKDFSEIMDEKYAVFQSELTLTIDCNLEIEEQVKHSVKVAEICNVPKEKIINTREDLDDFFLNGWRN